VLLPVNAHTGSHATSISIWKGRTSKLGRNMKAEDRMRNKPVGRGQRGLLLPTRQDSYNSTDDRRIARQPGGRYADLCQPREVYTARPSNDEGQRDRESRDGEAEREIARRQAGAGLLLPGRIRRRGY